jgi:hypothetical protein
MKIKNKITILMLFLLALVLFLHLLSLSTIIYLAWPISSFTLEKASALGDSYGVLNTLFSGLAFWGLIWTILLQRNDFRLQRVEAKRAKIGDLLLTEAKLCLTDLNQVKFTAKQSIIFPTDKSFNQWQFFYHAKQLMGALAENEITYEVLIKELTTLVMGNIEQFTYFYERLDQACDVARYMLADSEVPIRDLGEIKLLFFSSFNDDIFFLSGLMKNTLEALVNNIRKKQELGLHHPLPSILSKIGSINQFKEQEVDNKFVRSWLWTLGKQQDHKHS